jgi:RNA polymerase sigma-70 factor, ECF subfamily
MVTAPTEQSAPAREQALTDSERIERFTALYDRYYRRVYAYAVSRAGRQLAEEITSEVFLVAWRRLADLPAHELPWLLTVARNVAASEFRAAALQQSIAAEMRAWVTEAEAAADDIADQITERIALLTALATLPESDRELLALVAWHGLAPAEAARVVGCSTATYFVRLHRARRRLEHAMRDQALTGGGRLSSRGDSPREPDVPVLIPEREERSR